MVEVFCTEDFSVVELPGTGQVEVHCSSFSTSPRGHFLLSSAFLPNTTLTIGSAVLSASKPSLHLALRNPGTLPALSEVLGQSLRSVPSLLLVHSASSSLVRGFCHLPPLCLPSFSLPSGPNLYAQHSKSVISRCS